MWLFWILYNFLFDYMCYSTAAYLILIDLSKPFDLEEWFDKKV